jgi:protein involved in polysaccharide export with SLBB domain
MTATYAFRYSLLLCLLLPLATSSQSLEDKLSQARKQQAEAEFGLDSMTIDSLLAEKNQRRSSKPAKVGRTSEGSLALDSLLSGPIDTTGLDDTTVTVLDSLGRPMKVKRKLRKPAPKRYEQRVFANVDRSLFSSVSGSAGREYILGAGDEISVALWGDKEKEYTLILNRDGKVFLEGIGQVLLAGQTLDGAQDILRQRLAKIYSGFSRGTTHLDVSLGKAGPIRVFILGNVKVPGGYVFSGNTSVLSAMYFAQGPSDIGTVRNLQLTRSGHKFNLDLYKYLIFGESLSPNSLQDGDIIFSGRAESLVEVSGDVGRPAVYELKKGEGVKELLEFAGGINATAATHKLTLQRIFENGKLDFVDLATPQDYLSGRAKMELRDGDRVTVDKSTETPGNFLTISGPVKYPGTYEATGTTTVPQLVAKAGGLREDAFLGRVHVVRFHPDGSSSLLAYSLNTTKLDSISLMPRDNVILYSVKDMYLPDSVEISGAVFNPGTFEFRDGMTVKDLIMQAGGLLPHHENGKVLIFRGDEREPKVESITLVGHDALSDWDNGFKLSPNDFVQVPVDPNWYKKEIVSLEGLFVHPGEYSLLYPGEKLVSVIERAGGFKKNGYVEGGRFFRSKDSVGRVGVDISLAMRKPNGKANIPLVSGDSIFIPARLNTVKVIGEVGFETSILYQEGATVQYYINKAGGFTRRSEKDRVVVQYANGESSRDGFFNRKPDAGSVIYVPQGPEPKPIDWFAGLNALLGTLGVAAAVILSIQAISNN